jgi:hypothetical protein
VVSSFKIYEPVSGIRNLMNWMDGCFGNSRKSRPVPSSQTGYQFVQVRIFGIYGNGCGTGFFIPWGEKFFQELLWLFLAVQLRFC